MSKLKYSKTPPKDHKGVTDLWFVRAGDLNANPQNWRKHPKAQREALTAALKKYGWAGAALYNLKTGVLIDGHLRKDLDPEQTIPVLVGEWTPDEQRGILLTLDPIAAMAEEDAEMLRVLTSMEQDLIAAVEEDNDEMASLGSIVSRLENQAIIHSGGDESYDSSYDPDVGDIVDYTETERQEARRQELPLCPTCQRPLSQSRLATLQKSSASRQSPPSSSQQDSTEPPADGCPVSEPTSTTGSSSAAMGGNGTASPADMGTPDESSSIGCQKTTDSNPSGRTSRKKSNGSGKRAVKKS